MVNVQNLTIPSSILCLVIIRSRWKRDRPDCNIVDLYLRPTDLKINMDCPNSLEYACRKFEKSTYNLFIQTMCTLDRVLPKHVLYHLPFDQ